MSNRYSNILLTIIAVFLCAIVAKLYLPSAQVIGPRLGSPTLGEMTAAGKIENPVLRREKQDEIRNRMHIIFVRGNVDVDNTVQVEGEVSINQ